SYLAVVYRHSGQAGKALVLYRNSAAITDRLADPTLKVNSDANLGWALWKTGKYSEALSRFSEAASLLETMRTDILAPEQKLTYFTSRVVLYENFTGLLAQLARSGSAAPQFSLTHVGPDYTSAAFH